MEIFSIPYFWTYIFGSLFSFSLLRGAKNFNGSNQFFLFYLNLMGMITSVALYVFLIIGFWKMPAWWYPIVLFIMGIITKWIPIPDFILMIIGLIAAPALTILTYIYLFS